MAKRFQRREWEVLARLGAATRLEQLERERAAILRAFPGLRSGRSLGARPENLNSRDVKEESRTQRRRGRRRMSAGERKAVSLRMKRYWAARRQQKGASTR